jgi:hypothetical protein
LRTQPINAKRYLVFGEVGADALSSYRVIIQCRGSNPVALIDRAYSSLDDVLHGIFVMRCDDLRAMNEPEPRE